jgi:hypothetical protein
VRVVAPSQLFEYFELLVGAYRPDSAGKLLVQCLRADWRLFEHPKMDDARAKDLLAEILNDGEIVRQTFSAVGVADTDHLGEWEKLRDELMYRNRYFPDVNIDLDRLKRLLSSLTLDENEHPDLWYRARIQMGDAAFLAGEMGAPPKRTAAHGRANPAGIPYLYLASTQGAAIAEIRPHTGEIAFVCEFRTPPELKLVDLRSPRKSVSPFLLADSEDIARMRSDLPFLERLGEELTRPVVPMVAAIDYTPSQYLCEFIKKCGYHGVVYRSSVSEGINVALFYPEQAQAGVVSQYRVTRVAVEIAAVKGAA